MFDHDPGDESAWLAPSSATEKEFEDPPAPPGLTRCRVPSCSAMLGTGIRVHYPNADATRLCPGSWGAG